MPDPTRFARLVYRVAGVYGLLALLPHYLLEERIGRDAPPPITHPEYFYGFVGVAVAWQLAFLCIAQDPHRYRTLMPVTVVEKLTFGVAALVLFAQGRSPAMIAFAGSIDLVLAVAFVLAYHRTPRADDATRVEPGAA